jgi:hypothetical protein
MKSSEIKLLEDEGFFDYDYWDGDPCPLFHSDFSSVDYSIDEQGFVDWSIEIPISIKRLRRIEGLLNPQALDISNKISHYWPK